jgi:hypothetical protein
MLCVVFATFLLHRELPDMILGDKPLLSQGVVSHIDSQTGIINNLFSHHGLEPDA